MIKFRGYDKIGGMLYNTVGFIDFANGVCQLAHVDGNGNCYAEVKRNLKDVILEQYTGFKGGNNMEICEGDKISDGYTTFVVEWDETDGMFTVTEGNVSYDFSHIIPKDFEIVGDIHE